MDISSIVGLAAGLTFIMIAIFSGGSFFLFVNLSSIMIVGGGTISATLIHYPLNEVLGVIKVAKKAFHHKEQSPLEVIKTMVSFAETARREGILSLEQRANKKWKEILEKYEMPELPRETDAALKKYMKNTL